MAVNLARPTTGLGAGVYGNTGSAVISANSTEYAIKAFSVDVSVSVPIVEVTGSGDDSATGTVFITGAKPTGTFRITGAMVVSAALGLATLPSQDTASSPPVLAPDAKLTLTYGGHANNNFADVPVYIESIQIQSQIRQGAIVGVVMSGRFSGHAF